MFDRYRTRLRFKVGSKVTDWMHSYALGGTVTEAGGYRIHTFTSSDLFRVIKGGFADVLLVAGGAGGGRMCGGGGAGGFLYKEGIYIPSNIVLPVTIGAGGAHGVGDGVHGSNGNDSIFAWLTAIGGGAGSYNTGFDGGSGGGCWYLASAIGGSGTSGQGNKGGNGYGVSGNWGVGGGGGGAGAAGANPSSVYPTAGGAGLACSINGSSVYYAGGGGGGTTDSRWGYGASGGVGGGGASAYGGGTNGTANTGGGGGSCYTGTPGDGGSGICIVRYRI